MKAATDGVAAGGMTSATHYPEDDYGTFTYPSSMWSLEIAFPIRSTPGYSSGTGDARAPNDRTKTLQKKSPPRNRSAETSA
jgi:hypothetical protein